MSDEIVVQGRRKFLQFTALAGGGFMLGFNMLASAATPSGGAQPVPAAGEVAVTAWVRITPDNQVTLIVSQAEMGQGISTTLPAILADEMGADWSQIRLQTAPFASTGTGSAYRNPKLNWMFTGNSESIESFYDLMRKTGAAAAAMLRQAAASRWGVDIAGCRTENSTVVHVASGRRLSFGDVAQEAARLAPPDNPALKADSELKLSGRALSRVDIPAKLDGSAMFGIDFSLPGMLLAAIRTPPAIDGKLESYDEAAIKAQPGVHAVLPLSKGLVVVADSYWQARSALQRGKLEFSEVPDSQLDSPILQQRYRQALEQGPWVTPVSKGQHSPQAASFSRDYENPFLAHATMEPMNCTASVTADKCEIWAPTQGQELAFMALKAVLGMRDEQIVVHRSPYMGGGFGRRLLPDFVIQAALISKAVGKPVKLIWDREEDMRRDLYRPATMVRLSAALDKKNAIQGLQGRVVSPTILLPVFPPVEAMLNSQGFDPSAMEGMLETIYDIPNWKVDFHLLKTAIPTSVMRTTGYGPNIFALESFIDELAHAARIDPYRYRRQLLAKNPRMLAALDRVAVLSDWAKPLPKGKGLGRGIACTEAFGSLLAQVIQVQVKGAGVKVARITTVVDCGRVLDRGIASNNIEGGAVFGLSYCKSEITFNKGRVVQDNLNTYDMPRLSETPVMQTEFIDSGEKLGGVGEVSPVTVPPALANAIFAATGKRLRAMPLSRHGLHFI
ncbi:MAG: molybdopterin cofactor-binding domain-containing protein [Pseudomonadota bacterium]